MRGISVMGSIVKHCLGLCFWGFAGFVGGAVLLAWRYTFFTDTYSQWQIEVGILGGFLGAGCLSAEYIVTCRCGFSLRKKGAA